MDWKTQNAKVLPVCSKEITFLSFKQEMLNHKAAVLKHSSLCRGVKSVYLPNTNMTRICEEEGACLLQHPSWGDRQQAGLVKGGMKTVTWLSSVFWWEQVNQKKRCYISCWLEHFRLQRGHKCNKSFIVFRIMGKFIIFVWHKMLQLRLHNKNKCDRSYF